MELKDFLPLVGILVGWMLAEGSAYGKREIERRRITGRALSVLYFLFQEMVQLKKAQEDFKNRTQDVKEWERLRQRSFEKYTVQNPEFLKKLDAVADSLGEYYPVEAYEVRELVQKYEFLKSKKLDSLTASPELYVRFLSGYEMGFLAHQYKLELIIRFLARKQSWWLWLRVRHEFWKLRRSVAEGDLVFLQQVKGRRKRRQDEPQNSERIEASSGGAASQKTGPPVNTGDPGSGQPTVAESRNVGEGSSADA